MINLKRKITMMINNTRQALITLTDRYLQQWQQVYQSMPKSAELHAIASPCIVKTAQLEVYWQPVRHVLSKDLTITEQVMTLTLQPDLHDFYGTQYAADLPVWFAGQALTLLQVWSDDDFNRLQQNIIAHLTMQKKLKRPPTIFIATTEQDNEIIALDNRTGEVIIEELIEGTQRPLCAQLADLLEQAHPRLPSAQ